MSITETTLFGEKNKEKISIERIKQFEPPEGYVLNFSGGKDSIVLHDLTVRAGVKYRGIYNITTADPPELVQFITQQYPDIWRRKPEITMWRLIEKKKGYPPTRRGRYCCEYLKERRLAGGHTNLTGLRNAESARRKRWGMTGVCWRTQERMINPIIDWEDKDVWDYIHNRGLKYCSLYDEGWKRLGCVMCPMANRQQMQKEAKRWPKIARAYKRAIIRGFNRRDEPFGPIKSGDEMFDWWLFGKRPPETKGTLFEEVEV